MPAEPLVAISLLTADIEMLTGICIGTDSVYRQEDQQKVGSVQSVDMLLEAVESYVVLDES